MAQRSREKICFVMMPFTDPGGYSAEHFKRVYRHLIQPACQKAGFRSIRVDDINTSNHIVIDIIRYIIEADMALCDLSARSPNVLYELGIRHAFNKPVTLIKDMRTARMFDIQGLRDIEYDESLRVDTIERVVPVIADSITNTYAAHSEGASSANTILQLVGMKPATPPGTLKISAESSLILHTLDEIRERLAKLERPAEETRDSRSVAPASAPGIWRGDPGPNGSSDGLNGAPEGEPTFVQHPEFGIGVMRRTDEDGRAVVDFFSEGMKAVDTKELKLVGVTAERS